MVVAFEIAGYSRVFTTAATGIESWYPWVSEGNAGSLTMSVNDLEGGFNLSDLSITVLDINRQITEDLQTGINLLGNQVSILVGFRNMPKSEYVTIMTMVVDHIDLANQNTAYKFTFRDNSLYMQQYSFQIADDGYPTGQNHVSTQIGTPMQLLYDAVIQSGLNPNYINTQAIIDLNQSAYFGMLMDFEITYPPRAKDWIEQEILKPLGAYWFWNNMGQLTPYSMLPYSLPVPAMTLDETNISVSTPPVPMRSQDYTAVIIYKMDGNSNGQNFQTNVVGEYAPAVNLYGISQSRIIQSRGVRSTMGGTRIAHLTIQNIFQRYGMKPFTYKPRVFLSAMLLEVGDKVTLNHSQIPNGMWPAEFRSSGPMGLTGTLWEVKGKTVDFNDGSVQLDLLDVSWQIQNGTSVIAPDGTAPYSGNTGNYMYYSSADSTYSNGDAARLLY